MFVRNGFTDEYFAVPRDREMNQVKVLSASFM